MDSTTAADNGCYNIIINMDDNDNTNTNANTSQEKKQPPHCSDSEEKAFNGLTIDIGENVIYEPFSHQTEKKRFTESDFNGLEINIDENISYEPFSLINLKKQSKTKAGNEKRQSNSNDKTKFSVSNNEVKTKHLHTDGNNLSNKNTTAIHPALYEKMTKNMIKKLEETSNNVPFNNESIAKKSLTTAKNLKSSQTENESTKPSAWSLVTSFIETYNAVNVDGQLYVYINEIYEAVDSTKTIGLMMLIVPEAVRHKLSDRDYKNAYQQLMWDLNIRIDEKPENRFLVDFENGLFNLKELRFIPRSPEHFVVCHFKASFNASSPTPTFDRFIKIASNGDKEIAFRILQFLAYCIIPGNAGKYFFVLGTASNSGKSVLAKFLEELFGKKFVSHVALHDFGGTFDLGSMANKFLNTAMDLSAKQIPENSVSKLKSLTGGDSIALNVKFTQPFSYLTEAKLVFGTNHAIHLDSCDTAFWERLIFVPFVNSIPKSKQDHELINKFREEKDGIFYKMVRIANFIIMNNYKFEPCRFADITVNRWRYGKDDGIYNFIREECVIDTDSDMRTHSSVLYDAYSTFCQKNNYDRAKEIMFGETLRENFGLTPMRWVAQTGGGAYRGYKGIALKNED